MVVVTNQSGVALGYYTEEDVGILHRHIAAELAKTGARVDAWYYCPHHPSGRGSYSLPCRCRKPLPGMLLEAALRHNIDLAESVMIGDKLADVEAGQAAGCRTILVAHRLWRRRRTRISTGTVVCDDLLAGVLYLVRPREGFDRAPPRMQ